MIVIKDKNYVLLLFTVHIIISFLIFHAVSEFALLYFLIPAIDANINKLCWKKVFVRSIFFGWSSSYICALGLAYSLNRYWTFPEFLFPFTGLLISVLVSFIFITYFLLLYLYSLRVIPLFVVFIIFYIIQIFNLNFMPFSISSMLVNLPFLNKILFSIKSYGVELVLLALSSDLVSLFIKINRDKVFRIIIFILMTIPCLVIPYFGKPMIGESIKIGFIQPFSPHKNLGVESSKKMMLEYSQQMKNKNLDILIFPESSIPRLLIDMKEDSNINSLLYKELAPFHEFSKAQQLPILLTLFLKYQEKLFNVLVFINSSGQTEVVKPKYYTFPLFEDKIKSKTYTNLFDFLKRNNLYSDTIKIKDTIIYPLICYESIFHNTISDIDLVLELSNNSYFENTNVLLLHEKLAYMRASENGNPILRTTNSGISSYYDFIKNNVTYYPVQEGIYDLVFVSMDYYIKSIEYSLIFLLVLIIMDAFYYYKRSHKPL